MRSGDLGVSSGTALGTSLHTTGHTATGQWNHAALRAEHMDNRMKWSVCPHTTTGNWREKKHKELKEMNKQDLKVEV